MKIYIAGPGPHLKLKRLLLSFYDLEISTLPFRKKTFKILKNKYEKNKYEKNK